MLCTLGEAKSRKGQVYVLYIRTDRTYHRGQGVTAKSWS